MSVILNFVPVGFSIQATAGLFPCSGTALLCALLVNTQFADQAKVKDTSQLINGMSSVLQKLLQYLNGTTVSNSSFSLLPSSNFPAILVL